MDNYQLSIISNYQNSKITIQKLQKKGSFINVGLENIAFLVSGLHFNNRDKK